MPGSEHSLPTRSGDDYVTTLDAPRLLNAVGRAGRAGRETEGWVVLSRNEEFTPRLFAPLAADDKDLTATSHLSTEDALEALAAFVPAHAVLRDRACQQPGAGGY